MKEQHLRMLLLMLVSAVLLVLIVTAGRAHSPEDTDPAMADWFRSLTRPDIEGSSCCSEQDCFVLKSGDMKIVDGVYWIRDPEPLTPDQEWIDVLPHRILKRYDNPTGKYVACVIAHHVICFVQAAGI